MTEAGTTLLEAREISKHFAQTRALAGASLSLRAGATHALLGANGAGKSTLSRVISGHIRRDSGEILYRGRPLDVRSPREALDAGIAMVMQETSLAPDLSVLENIFLPDLRRSGRLSRSAMRRRAGEILADLGQERSLSLEAEARDLSAAQRQLVEIAKALALNANLIVFDEPTASLSPSEVERLFDVIARLEAANCAVVFVSHRLEEVFAISDEITVMREGRTVAASRPTSSSQSNRARAPDGRAGPRIDLRHAGRRQRWPRRTGAIGEEPEGAAGGARCLVRSASWRDPRPWRPHRSGTLGDRGDLVWSAPARRRPSAVRRRAPSRRVTQRKRSAPGLASSPRTDGGSRSYPDLSVRENLLLGHLGAHRGFGLGYGALAGKVDELMERLELPRDRLADPNLLNFSGGMQQKIIIARWLLLEPKALILDEPTKGVDIGTRASIYAILRDIAAKGAAILVISSEFEELLGLADRVIVMSDGASIADVPTTYLDEAKLTLLAAPRSSMERNRRVLQELASEQDGAAFWAILDEDRVFCLNAAAANAKADPALRAGATPRFEETQIAAALRARSPDFVLDPVSGLRSLLVDVKSHRGHELGSIGLVIGPDRPAPPAEAMRAAIIERFGRTV